MALKGIVAASISRGAKSLSSVLQKKNEPPHLNKDSETTWGKLRAGKVLGNPSLLSVCQATTMRHDYLWRYEERIQYLGNGTLALRSAKPAWLSAT